MGVPEPGSIVGVTFAPGSFRITAEDNRTTCGILGGPVAADGSAHPIYAFIGTRRGGPSVLKVLETAGATLDNGPMLGALDATFDAPIMTDTTYDVTGEVTGFDRKVGRKTGVFDVMTFVLRLVEQDGGAVVASCGQSWIIPRKELDHA